MGNSRGYILVVEDSRTQADLLCHLLSDAGYETTVAGNGGAALESVRERTPDLLLSDIVMPGMDGYALCRAVKTDPSLASIPVILVTQLYDPEDVIKGISCGANNFIIKPFDQASLLSRIEMVLHSRIPDDHDATGMVVYNGKQYPVLSEKEDLLHILLSIYDTALSRNLELEQATERLHVMTGSLEELVEERTQALERTSGTVQQLLMQKNELITKIGHDLKTPLTPLVALLPHVYNHEKDGELKEILNVLVNDVQVLKGLVEQTLTISLLNKEYFSMEDTDIPVHRVIHEVISGYTFSIRQMNISVVNKLPPDCTVYISPFHITTIFENLISNAIKYNRRDGMITFDLFEEGSMWAFSITDTGIGLTPEEAVQVFDEFYKADPARHDHSSHGLGLSIVHRIVTMYGGSISVSSRGRGEGATFIVKLPRYIRTIDEGRG